jgi:hypothetical protein
VTPSSCGAWVSMTDTGSAPGPARASESPAGYSGTPLVKKLGVKPGHLVLLKHAPTGWRIPDLPAGAATSRRAAGRADIAGTSATSAASAAPDITIAFCRSRRQLERDLPTLIGGLPAGGALWVAWPRRAAGHSSDITENGLREVLLPRGVVDVKVAALDRDWSGLKFVWRKTPLPRRALPRSWS